MAFDPSSARPFDPTTAFDPSSAKQFDPSSASLVDQRAQAGNSLLGSAKEFGKGALLGAAELAPEVVEGGANLASAAARKMGFEAPDLGATEAAKRVKSYAEQNIPVDPNSTAGQVGRVVGQIVPYGAAALAGPVGIAGAALAGGLQAGSGAEDQTAALRAQGKPVDQGATDTATLLEGAAGTILGVIPGANAAMRAIPATARAGLVGYLARTVASGGVGGGVGALQTALNNAIEQYTIDPDKTIGEGVASQGAIMSVASAIAHGAFHEPLEALQGHRQAAPPPPAPEAPGAPPGAPAPPPQRPPDLTKDLTQRALAAVNAEAAEQPLVAATAADQAEAEAHDPDLSPKKREEKMAEAQELHEKAQQPPAPETPSVDLSKAGTPVEPPPAPAAMAPAPAPPAVDEGAARRQTNLANIQKSIEAGKPLGYDLQGDGSIAVTRAGAATALEGVPVRLTKDENRAFRGADLDLETAKTPEDRAAAKAEIQRVLKGAVQREMGGGEPPAPAPVAKPVPPNIPVEGVPPIPEGHLRVYRGDQPGGKPAFPGSPVTGGWFTTDLNKARGFGDVSYMDIPYDREHMRGSITGHGGPDEHVWDQDGLQRLASMGVVPRPLETPAPAAPQAPVEPPKLRGAVEQGRGGQWVASETDGNGTTFQFKGDGNGPFKSQEAAEKFLQKRGSLPGDGSREAPVKVETPQDLETGRERIAEAPSKAQVDAGNAPGSYIEFQGLPIKRETPKGGVREDRRSDTPKWRVEDYPADYGEIQKTKGADGEPVDTFIGPNPKSDQVTLIDQHVPNGKFDEHKAMLGFDKPDDAIDTYFKAFSDGSGPSRLRPEGVHVMSMDDFKKWLKEGDTTKPFQDYRKTVERAAKLEELAKRHEVIGGKDQAELLRKNAKQPPSKYEDTEALERMTARAELAAKTRNAVAPPVEPMQIKRFADLIKPDEGAGSREPDAWAGIPPDVEKGYVDAINLKLRRLGELGFATPHDVNSFTGSPEAQQLKREIGKMSGQLSRYAKQKLAVDRGYKKADPEKVQDALDQLRTDAAAPKTEPEKTDNKGRRLVGQNADGRKLWEDGRGVRSYVDDNGIRHVEPVQMRPSRDGVQLGVDRQAHPEFEVAGEQKPQALPTEVEKRSTPASETGHGIQDTVPAGDAGAGPEAVHAAAPPREDGRAPSAEELGGPRDAGSAVEPAAEGGEGQPGGAPGGGGAGVRDADRLPEGAGPGEAGAAGRPEGAEGAAARKPDHDVTGKNFSIEHGAVAEDRSPRVKAQDNLNAISLAKKLLAEGRPATREEQAALAKYVGWGGLAGAFEDNHGRFGKGFEEIGPQLRKMLGDEEYRTAQRSTQYAHYTAENVIRAMWDTVNDMGFRAGSIFEPGMGIGHFLGMMPRDLAARTRYEGIELDGLTADIAKLLYPESGVRHADFTQTPMPENAFDLVIGNPPFGDITIRSDPKYSAKGFLLHDYFFAKSLDSLRPGGLMSFVTSAGTMNKLDPSARQYLGERAEFLGGVRLPSSAFKKNAGTEVTTDILFFKKRPEPVDHASLSDAEKAWTETTTKHLPGPEGTPIEGNVNRYFAEHPDMVLGKEDFADKLYQGRYSVKPDGRDLTASLREALGQLPKDVFEKQMTPKKRGEMDFESGQKKDGSFYLKDGKLHQYTDGAGREVLRRGPGVEGGRSAAEHERIAGLVPIRDALRDVFKHDLAENVDEGTKARAELNQHYDNFVKKFGPLNKADYQYRRPNVIQQELARAEAREEARERGSVFEEGDFDAATLGEDSTVNQIARARQAARDSAEKAGKAFNEGSFNPDEMPNIVIEKRPNIDPFMDDPESYRLRSIEDYNDSTGESAKKRIFYENILSKEAEPKITSADDGVLWSLNKHGHLDVDAIAEKMGKSREDIIHELGDKIFRAPGTDTYQTADEYLSGDVVDKLAEARTAAQKDPTWERNVKALEKAQPAPIAPAEISMSIGMPWIPVEHMEAFARDRLQLGNIALRYQPEIGSWIVHERSRGPGMGEWGTQAREATAILSDALNKTPPRVYTTEYDAMNRPKQVFDPIATQAAQDKYERMRDAFAEWSRADPARADALAKVYNSSLNRVVLRKYDGDYLTTPGVASNWSWRPHQKRVVARVVQSGNTYMAHAVGAGKTSAMIGAGMEMRRLGLAKKPMYVVPNHMLAQFTKEFYEQYPTARIAVADERRFHTDRRKQFMANVSQDDLDAVIITHSSFGKIPISDGFQQNLIHEEVQKLQEALESVDKSDPTSRITVKRLEKAKERLEQRLQGRQGKGKDQTNTFEEMGSDFLFVDEAHEFRKLSFATKQSNLKGITPEGSGKSWDLYSKIRYLDSRNPGRAVVLASGTPVTNTMGELYTISRYLQREDLESRGLDHFDSWASTFGDTATGLEQKPDGSYEPVTRFSKFVNIPELYKMVGGVMDIVTPHQLEQYVVRPKLKGGERQVHLAPMTPELESFQRSLAERMKAIRERKGPPKKGDDIILSVINDGRHGAIDPRFVTPFARDNAPSKLNELVDNVHRIWKETKNQQFYDPKTNYETKLMKGPAAQMIFADQGVNSRGPNDFSGYEWIRRELTRRGVPANEVAFIKDYKSHIARQKLFNDVNEGKIRILVGSTKTMGTGVNAQRRLIALHNQDPLWYPSDDEQRVGRILRQGNLNPEIQVHDYSTKGTYDSTMWQMMGRKGRFIEQFFRGDPELRDMDDLGEASAYEQASAITTSDPRVIELTEMKQQLDKEERRATAHDREQYSMRQQVENARSSAAFSDQQTAKVQQDIAARPDISGDNFKATIAGQTYGKRAEAQEAMIAHLQAHYEGLAKGAEMPVAEIGGMQLNVLKGYKSQPQFHLIGKSGRQYDVNAGSIQSAEATVRGLENHLEHYARRKQEALQTQAELKPQLGKKFMGGDKIADLKARVSALETALKGPVEGATPAEGGPSRLETALKKDQGEPPAHQRLGLTPRTAPSEEEIAPGLVGQRQTMKYSQSERKLADAVKPIIDKMFPGAADRAYRWMEATDAGDGRVEVGGSYFTQRQGDAMKHIIAWSLEAKDPAHAVRHEGVHYLRHAGLLTEGEWGTLAKAAEEGGWLDKHNIERRYGDLDQDRKVEEAVAEEFAGWQRGERGQPPGVKGIFYKLGVFLRRVGTAARQILGKGATADDIFGKIERGDIGGRAEAVATERQSTWHQRQEPESDEIPRTQEDRDILDRATDMAKGSMIGQLTRRLITPGAYDSFAKAAASMITSTGGKAYVHLLQVHEKFKDVRDAVGKASPEMKEQFARAADGSADDRAALPPEMRRFADALKVMTQEETGRLQRLGQRVGRPILANAMEDYLGRYWKPRGQEAANSQEGRDRIADMLATKRSLSGPQTFLKARHHTSWAAARAAGLEPVFDNPVDAHLAKLAEMNRTWAGTVIAHGAKRGGFAQFYSDGKQPKDWHKLAGREFERMAQTIHKPDGTKAFVPPGHYYAPEGFARVMNNFQSTGLEATMFRDVASAFRKVGNSMNALQLGFSLFHPVFTTIDAQISRVGMGIDAAVRGEFGKAARYTAEGLTPLNWVNNVRDGNDLLKSILRPDDAPPAMRRLVDAFGTAGGRVWMERALRPSSEGAIEWWKQGGFGTALRQAALKYPGGGLTPRVKQAMNIAGRSIASISAPIMDTLVPRQKLGVFSRMAQDWLERNPNASDVDYVRNMQDIWRTVDNRLGEMVYDNIFWNKTTKDIAHLMTRSVGWNIGSLDEIGRGAADFGIQAVNKLRGRDAEWTRRMSYLIALPAVTALYGATYQYLSTGQGPQELKDYFFPKTGMTMSRSGQPERITIPSYMKDVVAWWEHPTQTAQNKAHPMVSLISQMLHNKDYYDDPIRDYNDPVVKQVGAVLKYAAKEMMPFSVQSTSKMFKEHPAPQAAMGMLGFNPAPGYISNPQGEANFLARQHKTEMAKKRNDDARQNQPSVRASP